MNTIREKLKMRENKKNISINFIVIFHYFEGLNFIYINL